jgi:hypothetical protein
MFNVVVVVIFGSDEENEEEGGREGLMLLPATGPSLLTLPETPTGSTKGSHAPILPL